MTTWEYVRQRIHIEVQIAGHDGLNEHPLSDEQWKTLPGLLELLFDQESRRREAVDDLARHVAKTGILPQGVRQWDPYLLSMRIQCAYDFVCTVQDADIGIPAVVSEPNIHRTEIDVRLWLFLTLWSRRFDHWLKLVAVEATTGRPFYGLDRAPLE